jgi:hypothetical protein
MPWLATSKYHMVKPGRLSNNVESCTALQSTIVIRLHAKHVAQLLESWQEVDFCLSGSKYLAGSCCKLASRPEVKLIKHANSVVPFSCRSFYGGGAEAIQRVSFPG